MIGGICTLIALAAGAVLSGNEIFLFLATAFFMAALVSLFLLLIARKKISIQIEAPETAEKGAEIPIRICARGARFIGSLRANGRAANLLCGGEAPLKALSSRGGAIEFTLCSPVCGKIEIAVDSVEIRDCLNLFRKRIRVCESASVLVLPDTFGIAVELGETNTPDMDSSEYSPVRPGSDPSELFGVRDYREGDALKRIHWKLSEKYDRTVVREASLPVARSILLLLDNAPEGTIAPEKASAAVEALMSASESLAGQGISHEIGWLNHETKQLELRRISSLDDLFGEQGAILSSGQGFESPMLQHENSVLSALLEADSDAFSRVFLFAAAQPRGMSAMDERMTLLLPEENPENAISCLREKLAYLMV